MRRPDKERAPRMMPRELLLGCTVLTGVLLLAVVLWAAHTNAYTSYADPIDPPQGYPKLTLSLKTVTPTLAHTGGVTLHYAIEIRNTGAYAAIGATLSDPIPEGTVFAGEAAATVGTPSVDGGVLSWTGDVGFDSTVVVSFSVRTEPAFSGTVRNTATISHPLISRPITVAAQTVVVDHPILTIEKSSLPRRPGTGKPLTYTLVVTNEGQPVSDLLLTVVDQVPEHTSVQDVGAGGTEGPGAITWTRSVTLALGETTAFTFSVEVDDVPSGTVISNADYRVSSAQTEVAYGDPYTTTVVDPMLTLSKVTWPDPPGSNREMTYILTLLNRGSLATNLVISDRIPTGVEYQRGGSRSGDWVSWALPSLDTGQSATFTYTVYVDDVMGVSILNGDYEVCCAEGICQPGQVLTSVIQGPTFEAFGKVDPIAHKPGGGKGTEVTPTLTVHNLGPGNARGAVAILYYEHISVQTKDLVVEGSPVITFGSGPECGEHCVSYVWIGDLDYGTTVTFTTGTGQNTMVGAEGTIYTATVVVTDMVGLTTTLPVTGEAIGLVTHFANVEPVKSGPPVIGPGQLLTYTIAVHNRGMSTEAPPLLTDVVPISTTYVSASDGGVAQAISETTVVSWVLPLLGPGDYVTRSFTVLVPGDLISGTKVVNRDYVAFGYGNVVTGAATSGPAVTTTVQELGLIHSRKQVTPTITLPGSANVLTYALHLVNSSAVDLEGVTAYDYLPWESSTYQRDAVASAGQVVSDIVSIRWSGDVAALSSETVTFTVLVDPEFRGPITNTAVISHPDLLDDVRVQAVAYVSEKPVLQISKSASPDPVARDGILAYTLHVVNMGQRATQVRVTDTLPANVEYVAESATAGGQVAGSQVRWAIPVLESGESRDLAFQVTVGSGSQVSNASYVARCDEGVVAYGQPVATRIGLGGGDVYLPIILRGW